MFISVIMANYNGAKYLSEAIESVIAQDYNNFEFIIIEDGSTDGSREIIEKYHRLYKGKIKPVYRSENTGQGACFNLGIKLSAGNIICFLDSDDFWFKNKLQNVYNAYTSKSKFAFHQHNLFLMRGEKISDQKFRDTLITGDTFSETKKTRILPIFSPTSSLSFSRDIIGKVLPIPGGFVTCADGYLTRTCFCYGEVAADHGCWGIYRVHEGNHTYENPAHINKRYVKTQLIPNLNKYYQKNKIDLAFSKNWAGKIYHNSPRKILQVMLRESRFNRIDSLIEKLI